MAAVRKGLYSIRMEYHQEGIALLHAGLENWRRNGGGAHVPYMNAVLAEAYAKCNDLASADRYVEESLDQIERPGWEERLHYAEALRIRGWIYSLSAEFEYAEAAYRRSLDWAREQGTKSWELRTSTSLARLWQSQAKRVEALELLSPIYEWFTEGFDTKDLVEAKALLEELRA